MHETLDAATLAQELRRSQERLRALAKAGSFVMLTLVMALALPDGQPLLLRGVPGGLALPTGCGWASRVGRVPAGDQAHEITAV